MKTILLTGCTDGIGLDAARQLVSKGHKVLMHGRNPSKLSSVAKEMGVEDANTFVADLSDMRQVHAMANSIKTKHDRLDVLVNNAGVLKAPGAHLLSKDGIDVRLAVNMVAPYTLAKELLPIIPKHGRVINVSSAAQAPIDANKAFPKNTNENAQAGETSPFSDFDACAQSKLGVIMWTNALANEHPDHVIASLNPASMIGTKMVKDGFGVERGKDIRVGSDSLVQAAVGKQFARASGKYFDNDRGSFGMPHPDANNADKSRALMDAMEEWLLSKDINLN